METLRLVAAALMVIAAHAEPLEVLESSYKVLNHDLLNTPSGAHQFSSRAIRTESKRPFEILEQSFKYLPPDSAEERVRGVVRSITSLTEEAQGDSNKKELSTISRRIAAQDPQEMLRQNNQVVSTSKHALISSASPARIITTLAPATFKTTTPVFVQYSTKDDKGTRPRTTQPRTHVNYSKVERNNRPRTTQPPTFVQYSTVDDRGTRPATTQPPTYRPNFKSTDFLVTDDRHERVSGPAWPQKPQPHLVSRHSFIDPPLSTGDPIRFGGTGQHMSQPDTKYVTPFYVQTAERFDDTASSPQPGGERKVGNKVVLRKVTKSKPSLNTLTTPSSFTPSSSQHSPSLKDVTFVPPSFVGVAETKAPQSTPRVPVTIPVPTTFVPIHAVTKDVIKEAPRERPASFHDSNRATNTKSQSSNYGIAIPIGGGDQSTSGSDSITDLKPWKDFQAQTSLEFEDVRPGEYGNPGAGSKVLPHPGAGNTALETLAGAGAVALMAYGISYALPLAAPLLLRRSDGSNPRQSSPVSRLMNWLDSRTGGGKRRRPHRRPLHSMVVPFNATQEGSPLVDFYESYDYDKPETLGGYESMTYEHDESRPMEPPFREDFEESDSTSLVYKDPEYPFNNPFNEVSTEFGGDSKGSVQARADTAQQSQKHVGPEYHSFGFDPLDGAYGDDPTNESYDFGKVTYEYDFTNTHINPAIVGSHDLQQEVQQNVDKVSNAGLGEKADVGSPSKGQDPHRSRPARKPKPRSSNIISDFFNSFRSRVPNHIANRRHPRKPQHPPAQVGYKPEPKPQYQSHLIPAAKPHNTYRPAPAPRPSYKPAPKPAPKPVYKHAPKPMGHRPPAKQMRPHPPRKQRRPMRGHKARPKMDVVIEGLSEDYAEDRMDDGSPTYVSLEQVNRLAEEEMEGVVRGYNRFYEAPWPPAEGSQAVSESPDQQEAANVLSFGEADASTGRHLNLDSTDYIYRSSEMAKKASQGRVAKGFTLAPDYAEFDYVDIQGSSADVDGRRSRSRNKAFQTRSQSQHGVSVASPGRSFAGMNQGKRTPSISETSASRPQPVSSFYPSARSRSADSARSVSNRFGSSISGFVPSNPGSGATSSGFVPAVPPQEQFNRRHSRKVDSTIYSSALDTTDLDLQKQYWLGHQNPVQIA